MPNVQVNLRVPEEYRGLVQAVTRRLRDDEAFAARLRELLDSGDVDPGVQAQLDDLRRRVEALEGGVQPLETSQPTDLLETGDKGHTGAAEGAWTQGEGRSRRLTDAGKAEVDRRIQAGETDQQIGKAVGIHRNAVSNWRRKYSAQG